MKRFIGGGGEEVTSFYPVRPECEADVPKTRFKTRAGKTLSERRWNAAFSPDGHLDIESVLRRIQRGGVHPQIKGAVWEILLGCYDPDSTYEEREQLRQHRRDQYNSWKTECKSMVPIIGSGKYIMTPIITDDGQPIIDSSNHDQQELGVKSDASNERMTQWMLGLHQIGLDVARTDRALVFYENPENQAKLWDILSVYSWVDGDLVYVQGMNDICSPMVVLFENEADAYWCFEHAMRRLRENFRCSSSSIGVQAQLGILSQVIKTVDPKLHQHLDKLGSAMSPVKSDIGGNITRLETKYLTDPSEFNLLYNLVRSEIKSKTTKSSSSCTNGLLWLTRAMDFLVQLFKNLLAHPDWSMSQVCTDSYSKTLKKWHNWLASSSFSVAMKLAPERKKFMEVLGHTGDTNSDMDEFCETFSPLLKENHDFLVLQQHLDKSMSANNNSNNKMKGLLKGLRYISQIFENENEMKIGFPTDVKHVAHIGWDGPSVTPPTWMNEFTSSPRSSPTNGGGGGGDREGRCFSEGSPLHESSRRGRRGIESPARDLPEIPKTRRSSRGGLIESPSKEKAERSKQTRRSSRNKESSSDGTRPARSHVKDAAGSESPSNSNPGPDIPKKTRRKKSKDSSLKPSSSSGPKAQTADESEVTECSESGTSIHKTSNNIIDHSHTSSIGAITDTVEDRQKNGVLGTSREC